MKPAFALALTFTAVSSLAVASAFADFTTDLESIPELLSPENQCDLAEVDLEPAEAFCENSIAFVCGKGNEARAPLERGLELYDEWADRAYADQVGFAKNEQAGMVRFVKSSYSDAIKKTANITMNWSDLNTAMAESVADLKAALKRKDIPTSARTKIEKNLNRIHMMTPEAIGQLYADHQKTESTHLFYSELCGLEGKLENAQYDDKTHELIICPAWVAAHAKLANTKEELMSILRQVILHEIGHAIDFDQLKPESKKLYADVTKDIPTTVADLFGNKAQNEVISDYLSIEGQIERFRGKGLSANYMAALLRNRYRTFCKNPSTDWGFFTEGHPPGGWRIEYLASHPGIRDLLRCKNTKESKQLKQIPNRPAAK